MLRYINDPSNHTNTINLKYYDKCIGKNILFQELNQIAQTKFNTQCVKDGNQYLKLTGIKCNDAKVYLEKILKFANEYYVPDTWQEYDRMMNNPLLMIDLQKGGNEWNGIEKQFKSTMP